MTGDLTENAADADYAQARELLASLDAPLYVLPGNHDDAPGLRRHFDMPGPDGEPVHYAADLGPLRLVVVDSTRPGEDPGVLDEERLARLDEELAAEAGVPTVIAMHHPPLVTGIPPLDEIGLPAEDRRALGQVVERHPQVRRIVAGHMHRAIASEPPPGLRGGVVGRVNFVFLGSFLFRPVVAAPSTYMQARLDLSSPQLELAPDPIGFAVHVLLEGELISHIQTLQRP